MIKRKVEAVDYDSREPLTAGMLRQWLETKPSDAVICVVDGDDCEGGLLTNTHAMTWGCLEEVGEQVVFGEGMFDEEDEHQILVFKDILDRRSL